jgi:hypothetical protein
VNLTQENYHSKDANLAFWSHSLYKEFCDCEARAMAGLAGAYVRKPSKALAFGSLLDRALTAPEKLRDFMLSRDAADSDGSSFFFDAKGRERDNAEMRAYHAVVDRVQADPVYVSLLEKGSRQEIHTGAIGGTPWRVMLDFRCNDCIADLKFMADFEDDWAQDSLGKNVKVPWYDAAGYYRQMAVYQHIVWQSTKRPQTAMLLATTKQEPPDMRVVTFAGDADKSRFSAEISRIESNMPHLDAVKRGEIQPTPCGKNSCAYCRSAASLSTRVEPAYSGRMVTV